MGLHFSETNLMGAFPFDEVDGATIMLLMLESEQEVESEIEI